MGIASQSIWNSGVRQQGPVWFGLLHQISVARFTRYRVARPLTTPYPIAKNQATVCFRPEILAPMMIIDDLFGLRRHVNI